MMQMSKIHCVKQDVYMTLQTPEKDQKFCPLCGDKLEEKDIMMNTEDLAVAPNPEDHLSIEQHCFTDELTYTDGSNVDVEIADSCFKYEVKDAPEQGTDKWLEWRKQGITATEAATIMYPSKWGSPLSIYTDKLGLTQRDQSDDDGYMEWGHRIEDLLVQKFMDQHKNFTKCTQGRLYQRDWTKCSLDAQCFNELGQPVIIECKTGQHEDKWDPIPERYYAQVQWQMYVTGIRKAYFSVLIQGHIWFEREVDYCPKYVSNMLERCNKVWECIQNKQPPATLGNFETDKQSIAALAGESGHSGDPVEVDVNTVGKYLALKEAYEKAEAEFMEFKNSLAMQMIDHSKLTCDGKTFATWVERKSSVVLDKKLLQQKYPDIFAECSVQGMGTRYVRYSV